MSLISYFKDKTELRSAKATAKDAATKIKAAIDEGRIGDVTNILEWSDKKTLELISTLDIDLMAAAFDKGRADIVDVLITKLFDSNPNQFFETSVSERISSDQSAWRTTYKTYLYSAMERKNAELALYLAKHPNLNLDQPSYQTFRGETTWQCSAIAQARDSGMLQVVIALAERLAEKRRDQGRKYMDAMNAQADGFDHEAEQLRRLDLPNGVYKFPALNKPEEFKL